MRIPMTTQGLYAHTLTATGPSTARGMSLSLRISTWIFTICLQGSVFPTGAAEAHSELLLTGHKAALET